MEEKNARHMAEIVAASWLPGALFGVHFGVLLFFLNPSLPFSGWTALRALLLNALLFGTLGSLVTLPWTRRRRHRALRFLPWAITFVQGIAAAFCWIHASHYAYFLPGGINVRLIKGAILLSVSALICFYTALLHSVANRGYGTRSRVAFWVLSILSVVVISERRLAYSPPQNPALSPESALLDPLPPSLPPSTRLLVVGIESATLDAILPLKEQGALPFFSRLIEEGSSARLASLRPNNQGSLWTTLSTGKLPYKHGILASKRRVAPLLGSDALLELTPLSPMNLFAQLWGGSQPVNGNQLKVLPLWKLLARLDVPVGVVGWPLSSPVEPPEPVGLQFLLSNRYFFEAKAERTAWPAEIEARARLFRLRTADLDPALLETFGTPPPGGVASAVAEDLWRSSLTSFFLDQEESPEVVFLLLPGLRKVSRLYFGGYVAAEFEGKQRSPYEEAALAVRAYYAWLDSTLAALWEQQGSGIMAVVSAHGAEASTGWRWLRAEFSQRRSLKADFHRSPDGVLLLYGEGVKAKTRLRSAELVDVTPTLLFALGLPIARDLDGRVLRDAFEPAFLNRQPLTFVPSYETILVPEQGLDDIDTDADTGNTGDTG